MNHKVVFLLIILNIITFKVANSQKNSAKKSQANIVNQINSHKELHRNKIHELEQEMYRILKIHTDTVRLSSPHHLDSIVTYGLSTFALDSKMLKEGMCQYFTSFPKYLTDNDVLFEAMKSIGNNVVEIFYEDIRLHIWNSIEIDTFLLLNISTAPTFKIHLKNQIKDKLNKKLHRNFESHEALRDLIEEELEKKLIITEKGIIELRELYPLPVKFALQSYPYQNQFNFYPVIKKDSIGYLFFGQNKYNQYRQHRKYQDKLIIRFVEGKSKKNILVPLERKFLKEIDFIFKIPVHFFKSEHIYKMQIIDVGTESYTEDEEIPKYWDEIFLSDKLVIHECYFRCSKFKNVIDKFNHIVAVQNENTITLTFPEIPDSLEGTKFWSDIMYTDIKQINDISLSKYQNKLNCYFQIPKVVPIDSTISYEELPSVINHSFGLPIIANPFVSYCSLIDEYVKNEFSNLINLIENISYSFKPVEIKKTPLIDKNCFEKNKLIPSEPCTITLKSKFVDDFNEKQKLIHDKINARIQERARFFYEESLVLFKNNRINTRPDIQYFIDNEKILIYDNLKIKSDSTLLDKNPKVENIGIHCSISQKLSICDINIKVK